MPYPQDTPRRWYILDGRKVEFPRTRAGRSIPLAHWIRDIESWDHKEWADRD